MKMRNNFCELAALLVGLGAFVLGGNAQTQSNGTGAVGGANTVDATNPSVAQVVLIPRGAVWKYLDDGSDQGTAWTGRGFDDSAWASGPAQLGYGDGDEATVVGYGGDATNRYITTYFRTTFTVTHAAAFTNLQINVLRDDGAATYLNGTRISRGNLPSTWDYRTPARSALSGSAESTYYSAKVSPTLLVEGVNVLAAEVHQAAANSEDLSFDFELVGIKEVAPAGTQTFIAKGSVWKYLDDGSDLGTIWTAPDFDDSAWASGPGQLGYGDGDEATVVSYGADPNNRYITTYFRKAFTVANVAACSNLQLRILRDDGAATYLNGIEISRGNLPVETDFLTLARSSMGSSEENKYYAAYVNPALLVEGRNVLAAEVHQCTASSVDLGFDFELVALMGPVVDNRPPLVQLSQPTAGQRFTAPATITLAADVTPGSSPILWVEFFANGALVGTATAAPYTVTWNHVPSASYVIKARVTDAKRLKATSASVTIAVDEPANLPPVVALVQPTNGMGFAAPADIQLVAQAYDADGAVAQVEFLANGTLLGTWHSTSGGSSGNGWPASLRWTNVPAGDYLLTARATDNDGATTVSAPVAINVRIPGTRPVVNIIAIDRLAVEATNDYGAFAVSRTGDPTLPLMVFYTVSGTASNGVDYTALSGAVTIPAGDASAQIVVEAITDDLVENLERVILTLVAPDCSAPTTVNCYEVGPTNSAAVVVISDPIEYPPVPGGYGALALAQKGFGPLSQALPMARLYELKNLASGQCQMTIVSPPGQVVTIEVSEDLLDWTPLATRKNVEGVLEFTDPTAGSFSKSFYRVIIEQ